MLFTKMHGLGNDFIVIEDSENRIEDYSKMAVDMCDRHFGVGGDGILIVCKSEIADSKMLIINSDGSQAEMCGNGIRCFAKYLFDKGIVNNNIIRIETLDGVREVELNTELNIVKSVRVNMGSPDLKPHSIPIALEYEKIVDKQIEVDGKKFNITSMLMGVPHTVIFTDNIKEDEIAAIGRKIEISEYFPKKTNVNFVKVINEDEFYIRTWERGAGLTLACGTGTCASLIACVLTNKTKRSAVAHLPGGDMFIEWSSNSEVYMTGPAETVFTGDYKKMI